MSTEDERADGEAFFSRWSRRKLKDKQEPVAVQPTPTAVAPVVAPQSTNHASVNPQAADQQNPATSKPDPKRPLTEADFADVDFSQLNYNSDYDRFLQSGVPESVRQKALTQLWHSDTVFTQVDPFQDYAGDFTDAATVPLGGVKTAYRVGQGFLTDDEAHTWDRLGKPDVAPALAALPELRPGYRVRAATRDDVEALATIQRAAILGIGREAYGDSIAESWAAGMTGDLFKERLDAGAHVEVAIQEDTGAIVAHCGWQADTIKALFVAPHHGRRRLAQCLLQRAIAAIEQERQIGDIRVEATRSSVEVYNRQGFQQVDRREATTRGGEVMEVFDLQRPVISTSTLQIVRETPDQPDVRAFFAASEAYMGALYPAESNHFVDAAMLVKPNVIFLVARLNGAAVGCGGVVTSEAGEGEIKRMWIAPDTRGLKLGRRILDQLEGEARAAGVTVMRLETGIHQPEAIGLYRRADYIEIGPFGAYAPDPLSLFMEKRFVAT